MYQEVKSLTKDALPYVLKKELEMVDLFKQMMEGCVQNKELSLTEEQIKWPPIIFMFLDKCGHFVVGN